MKVDKRRKALKALAIGAPAVWAKPVVDSVLLPAHADASGGGSVNEEEERPVCQANLFASTWALYYADEAPCSTQLDSQTGMYSGIPTCRFFCGG